MDRAEGRFRKIENSEKRDWVCSATLASIKTVLVIVCLYFIAKLLNDGNEVQSYILLGITIVLSVLAEIVGSYYQVYICSRAQLETDTRATLASLPFDPDD